MGETPRHGPGTAKTAAEGDQRRQLGDHQAREFLSLAMRLVPRTLQHHDRDDVVQNVMLRLCRQPPDGNAPREHSWRLPRLVRWEVLRVLAAGSCIALSYDVDVAQEPAALEAASSLPEHFFLLLGLPKLQHRALSAVLDGAHGIRRIAARTGITPMEVRPILRALADWVWKNLSKHHRARVLSLAGRSAVS
jgi:hypothetical protein